jgi:hypothetical protein
VPTPPEALRAHLHTARAAGAGFDDAWPDAVTAALAAADDDRSAWLAALHGTRSAWERAYALEPQKPAERAVLALVPLTPPGEGTGACEQCGGALPEPVRRARRFCSGRCRRRHAYVNVERPARLAA